MLDHLQVDGRPGGLPVRAEPEDLEAHAGPGNRPHLEPVDQIVDCPLFLIGAGNELRDTLQRRREQTGISYVVIQGQDPAQLERFAKEVIEPLSGC